MLREVYRREVFENRLLRRIFGLRRGEVTEYWGNLRCEGVCNLYSSPDVIRMIKSRRETTKNFRILCVPAFEPSSSITRVQSVASRSTCPVRLHDVSSDNPKCKNLASKYFRIRFFCGIISLHH
jgi:hypothetical protein